MDVEEADEGYGGGLSEDNRLTLAESIAPHWFLPPEGVCVHVYVCVCGQVFFLPPRINRYLWSSQPQTDPRSLLVEHQWSAHGRENVSPSHHEKLVLLHPPPCRGYLLWFHLHLKPLYESHREGVRHPHLHHTVSGVTKYPSTYTLTSPLPPTQRNRMAQSDFLRHVCQHIPPS